MSVDYDHKANRHTVSGPRVALPLILNNQVPQSVLDVGCGEGTWVKALKEYGVKDYFGVDGVDIPEKNLLFEKARFKAADFSKPWNLGRKFDLAICFEVAEHLPPAASADFVKAICQHTDHVLFSAGCPDQPGQNHINCHWPAFWQGLFNQNGFACEDNIRAKIWETKDIEVWYRQNMFSARRSPDAGKEKRVPGMVHAEFLPVFLELARQEANKKITDGRLSMGSYPKMAARAFVNKAKRKLGK